MRIPVGALRATALDAHRVHAQLIGHNIRRHRLRAGLSQEQLALRLGLDRSVLSGWERGRRAPSAASLERLAVALGRSWTDVYAPPARPQLWR